MLPAAAATEVHQQVTALLGHPLPRRVSRDPGQVYAPGAVLDEEQHSVECSFVAVHRMFSYVGILAGQVSSRDRITGTHPARS